MNPPFFVLYDRNGEPIEGPSVHLPFLPHVGTAIRAYHRGWLVNYVEMTDGSVCVKLGVTRIGDSLSLS